MKPDEEGWSVDGPRACHGNGTIIEFAGDPASNDFQMTPAKLPEGIDALGIARLLRQGADAYRRHFAGQQDYESPAGQQTEPKDARTVKVTVKRKRAISRPGQG
ncbi:MAG: hypothetical protein WED00_06170 [Aquisalimonadaceae bacterium]